MSKIVRGFRAGSKKSAVWKRPPPVPRVTSKAHRPPRPFAKRERSPLAAVRLSGLPSRLRSRSAQRGRRNTARAPPPWASHSVARSKGISQVRNWAQPVEGVPTTDGKIKAPTAVGRKALVGLEVNANAAWAAAGASVTKAKEFNEPSASALRTRVAPCSGTARIPPAKDREYRARGDTVATIAR